ncbi:MAG: hypothetical protein RMK29_21650 [Myxococcales bacterium]|nr:hypothetical protein [Myxococcota bacterium]MDW8284318.1 hypothetical protein [Myxococcales bacterium]
MFACARLLLPLLLVTLGASACRKKEPLTLQPVAPPPPAEAALRPIGMVNPFVRLSGPEARALERGYRALRARKPDEAAAAFAEVVAAAPDHLIARSYWARALAASGELAAAREQAEELLARDLVAQLATMTTDRDWKPLRESKEWAQLQTLAARYRAAYARGLDRGLVLVARSRAAKVPTLEAGEGRAELNQEAYHYDPASARYRRLTSTGGQVYAALRSPDGRLLAFLLVARLRRGERGDLFVDPEAGFLDLRSLETVGPMRIGGAYQEIDIGFASDGTPLWTARPDPDAPEETFVVDTARTGMARAPGLQVVGGRIRAWTTHVSYTPSETPAGVRVAADGRSFTVEGVDVIRAVREIHPPSLQWSPGRVRLTYAGRLDACQVLSQGDQGQKNEIYVYDRATQTARRIDSGISEFQARWLDDTLLAYENGLGARGTVNLYDMSAHRKIQLAPRHGAGLYGVPGLRCDRPLREAELPDPPPPAPAEG